MRPELDRPLIPSLGSRDDTFVDALVGSWGSWAPTLSADGRKIAFVSDRRGKPEIWICGLDPTGAGTTAAEVVPVSDDPVTSVTWSADGEWLACTVAPDGGVRTHVWVVKPDGTGLRRVAGSSYEHAGLGPWSRSGHQLVVSLPRAGISATSRCDLVDPATGERQRIAHGGLVEVLDLSADNRFALLRGGRRGAHHCVTLNRDVDQDFPLLPYQYIGSTEFALFRPTRWTDPASPPDPDLLTAFMITDAGLPRPSLAAVDLGAAGARGDVGVLAARDDGDLERIDADDAGRLLTLVWNVDGRSVLELFDVVAETRTEVPDVPGGVITGCVLARNGRSAVLSVEGPHTPPRIWRLELPAMTWVPVDEASDVPSDLIEPTLEFFVAHDGLPLTGWLYRAPGVTGPGPVLLSFHGGPESQERPQFSAQHQAVAAAGITVFAPNVRGSTGFGRVFAHADDRNGRYQGISDVASCVHFVTESGIADPGRIGISGRSYGGYLTLVGLTRFPHLFAAGIDICGMSDLMTFYRDTEPWIAEAAVSKYGHPDHDRSLLEDLSPLKDADMIKVPLLVVHGEHDTNVPINEARQLVAELEALDRPVEYLELPGEGHEYRFRSSKQLLVTTILDFLRRTL